MASLSDGVPDGADHGAPPSRPYGHSAARDGSSSLKREGSCSASEPDSAEGCDGQPDGPDEAEWRDRGRRYAIAFGAHLQELRERSGVATEAAAEAAGMPVDRYERMEAGEAARLSEFTVDQFWEVLCLVGCDPLQFFLGADLGSFFPMPGGSASST